MATFDFDAPARIVNPTVKFSFVRFDMGTGKAIFTLNTRQVGGTTAEFNDVTLKVGDSITVRLPINFDCGPDSET